MSKTELSLLQAKGVSKPLTKLIEVVSGAIGRVYTPIDKILNAYADTKSAEIHAIADKTRPLAIRAAERVAHIEERRQQNIEKIIAITASELPPKVSAKSLDTDWVSAFFDHCKDIGNEHMQQIWAKILAGEVARPSSFSKRTLAIVQSMSKEEATSFTRFGSILFEIRKSEHCFLIPDHEGFNFIRKNIITIREEVKLKDIGLLSGTKLYWHAPKNNIAINYFGESYSLCIPERKSDQQNETKYVESFDVPYMPLTDAGNELLSIAGSTASVEYLQLWQKEPSIPGHRFLKPGKSVI
ncbi:DUF2806 domain-containing protein [Janthinobacterium lividum]